MCIVKTKKQVNRIENKGFSLAELLVSMAVGMIVLVGVATIFASNVKGNSTLLKSARMNQDVGAIMTIMNSELRRGGYNGGNSGLYGIEEDINIVNSSCILYSYDYDQSNTVENSEKYGYKLEDGFLKMRTSCATGACFSDCTAGTWVKVTDDNVITITDLAFTSTNSKCQNITDGTYWVTTGAAATQYPCQATSSSNITAYDSLLATTAGTFVTPDVGDSLIETRQVNMSITAALATDSEFIKTLSSSVRLRNDKVSVKQ